MTTFSSSRSLIGSFVLMSTFWSVTNSTPALCQTTDTANTAAAPEKARQEELIQQGTYSLRLGRRLDKGIGYFTEALKQDPQNARLKTLLGCAQAERAYTLSLALAELAPYEKRAAGYEARKLVWEQAQGDPKNPLFQKPAPEAPVFPQTQDDGRNLNLSPEAAALRIKELSHNAIQQFEEASRLAEKQEPVIRAELANLKGWGLLVLWRDPRRVVPESWPQIDGKPEGPDRAISAFELAADLQPSNDLYLQSLSDGCVLAASDPRRFPLLREKRFDAKLYSRGKEILRQLGARRAPRGTFWMRIGSLEGQTSFAAATIGSRSPESIQALERAVKAEPTNSLYAYALAAARATIGSEAELMQAIERGNAGGAIMPSQYRYGVPAVFVWIFPPEGTDFPQMDGSLVAGLERWVTTAMKQESGSDVARALTAVIGIARKFSEAKNLNGLSFSEKDQFTSQAMIYTSMVADFAKKLREAFPDLQYAALIEEAQAIEK